MAETTCLHRHNADNTWDSVCPNCSLIIARADSESDLERHELTHLCDPAVFRKPSIDYRVFFQK